VKPGSLMALGLIAAASFAGVRASSADGSAPDSSAAPAAETAAPTRLEALNPELAEHPYRLDPGERPFRNRLSVSPGFGALGADELFTLRVAYNPSPWLGYEGAISHNPGQSVHAVLHTVSALVRHPLSGRYQPYLTAGYGMILVFPGKSLNADPVTKNSLSFGGGLELYIRTDLALRAEVRNATVFGRQGNRDGVVAFNYLQETIGLSFYRSIRP
jgi:hypothetical protein